MSQSHKILCLEGLRGIAAFAVVVSHLQLAFYTTYSQDLLANLSSLPPVVARVVVAAVRGLHNGEFSVWLFWIMSAFVLSLQFFVRARDTPGSAQAHDYLEDATLRRYPRLLLPVFASVVFAYVIHSLGWMHNARLADTLGAPYDKWLSMAYRFPPSAIGAFKSAVWESFFAYDGSSTYNSVLWTMEKELYGSLAVFAFLGLIGHRRSRIFVYPMAAVINQLLQLHWMNAFVCGVALCDLFVNQRKCYPLEYVARHPIADYLRHSRALAVVLWAVVIVGAGFRNVGGVSYVIIGTLAIVLTLSSTITHRIMSSAIPVFLGKISFGLYLIHLPIIFSFSCWAYLAMFEPLGGRVAALLVSVVTCGLSVLLGYGLYVVADRPAIKLSRRLSSLIAKG